MTGFWKRTNTIVLVLIASVSVAAQDPVASMTPGPLPWPAPESWDTAGLVKPPWPLAHILLEMKTAYLQSALPGRDATIPTWLTARYQKAPSDTADLHIFVKHDDRGIPVDSIPTLASVLSEPPPTTRDPRVQGTIRILVTNKSGKIVFVAAGNTANDAWGNLKDEVVTLEATQRHQEKKEAKQRVKGEGTLAKN